MYLKVITYLLIIFSLMSVFCGAKTTTIDPSIDRSNKSDECAMEKEVCDDALDFQKEYNRMPPEQRDELISVLNSYIESCEQAKKACDKSLKGK